MTANRTYNDDEMLNALRAVARRLETEILSGPAYDAHRLNDEPRRNTVAIRFGTWRSAVEQAGLQSPTVKDGLQIACVICGRPFSGDRGKKARKTCSDECSKKLFAATRPSSKGDAATPQAARGRARSSVSIQVCARCGKDISTSRLEVHHRDRDPYNNAPDNLEVLCIACHKAEHRLAARACALCGKPFQPRRASQTFCGYQCSGRASAAARRGTR